MSKIISLIIPFYNEEDVIDHNLTYIVDLLKKIPNYNYEIVCVDDGSKDKTFDLLQAYHNLDKNIKVLKFARNFGKEVALTAGIDYASGDVVIPIDADLQDPPELIEDMLKEWEAGYKVVLMQRKQRNEGFLKTITASCFYAIINKISYTKIPANIGDFRLMDRVVIESLKQFKERNRFMKGILSYPGFKTTTLQYDRPERNLGTPKQNYKKLFALALDGIFAFSNFPLKMFTYFGLLASASAFFYASYLIYRTIVNGIDMPGYASMMVVMLFLGGIQLLGIGVLGEYIGRIFLETKQRPIYILEETLI